MLKLRTASVLWREVEGEIVALDLKTSQYLGINRTGAALWAHLVDGATEEELETHMVESYGVDRATAAEDLRQFIESLRSAELLEAQADEA